MELLNQLTIRTLKKNKRRTLATIIGIMLSTLLISLVIGIGTSVLKSLEIEAIATNGNYHVYFSNVKKEDADFLTKNRETKSYFYFSEVGIAKTNFAAEMKIPYLQVMGFSENMKENYPIRVIEGRLPENDSEIAFSAEYETLLEESYHIGDTVTLELGTRVDLEGKPLSYNDSIWEQKYNEETGQYDTIYKDYEKEEKLINVQKKTYTLVGFVLIDEERPHHYAEQNNPYMKAYTVMDTPGDYTDFYLLYRHPSNYEKTMQSMEESLSNYGECKESICSSFNINENLLDTIGVKVGPNMALVLYTLVFIILAIVVAASVITIRSSFSISASERYREFGMLSSVGATSKQIFKTVLLEGFFLGLIAIPIGLILGILSVFGLVQIMNHIFADFMARPFFHYYLPWYAILFMFLAIALTIFLSAFMPARYASKLSAIDAIRGNSTSSFKKRNLKVPKIISKIFGMSGEIAYKNLKRSKRKYRTTIVSIVVSVTVFIAMFYSIHTFYRVATLYMQGIEYNIQLNFNGDSEQPKEKFGAELSSVIEMLDTNKEINRYAITQSVTVAVSDNTLWNKDFREFYIGQDYMNSEIKIYVEIMAVGEHEFDYFVNQIGGKRVDYEKGAILIDDVHFYREKKDYLLPSLNVKEGDELSVEHSIYFENGESEVVPFSIPILKGTSQRPLSIPDRPLEGYPAAYLIVSDSYYQEILQKMNFSSEPDQFDLTIYIDAKDVNSVMQALEEKERELDASYMWYENLDKNLKISQATKLAVSIFLYGFIGMVALIGITNVFNTITTNLILRSREFAMLEAIGMTKKEFQNMIRLESLFYGVKSLTIGIVLGLLLSRFLYTTIVEGFIIPYQIPWNAILLCVIFVFLIIYTTMTYSLNKIKKQNIMETIRSENI